ncbi:MAG: HlyD family secretion protein [Candidatus Binataceae bacterium]|nr:HlyD family secretion protein [Candidatus Binataceae bacterium]
MFAAFVLAGLIIEGVRYWNYVQSYVATEDAQTEADISPVGSRIQGTVIGVHVKSTQRVEAGQLAVELDPRDYKLAVDRQRAALAEAAALTGSAQSSYVAATAKVNKDRAREARAQSDARRYTALLKEHVASAEQYDNIISAEMVAVATVQADEAAAAAALKNVAVRQAAIAAAQVALDEALLNLSYTKIHSPVDGIVGNKTVEIGERVQPGQGLFSVTSLDDLWVTANFKETWIGELHPGQRATIHVDALGRDFDGYVEGLGGATGALYSLLPPENATGNWIRVVQRLPVRIRFDHGQDPPTHLRPGLSAEVKVWLKAADDAPQDRNRTSSWQPVRAR